jgi:predicted SprT family Zn-dependent metalloprotease
MELQAVKVLADKLLNQYGLFCEGWRFNFDKAKRRAGSCKFSNKKITLAKAYAGQENLKEVKNTLLHEIAHALVGPEQGHNQNWRIKALEIGCDAERCHQVVFTKPRYRLTCKNKCFEVFRHRVNQTFLQTNFCSKCQGELLLIDLVE